MHSYERTYPVYREQVMDRQYEDNKATWHLVVGAAGCQEYLDRFGRGRSVSVVGGAVGRLWLWSGDCL